MKLKYGIFALAMGLTFGARAQSSHGYGFVGVGGITVYHSTSSTLGFGFGGEARILPHLGAGVELSALGPTQDLGSMVGLLSPNGYVHLQGNRAAKIDPYVTGGYTLMFRSGHANLANFGGGVNIWPKQRLGLMLEFRDHVYTRYSTIHYWGFRAGIAFR